jgi:hypothetical protein
LLLSRYAARNLTTAFASQYPVWTAGSQGGGEFDLDVRIRIPPNQLLLYRCAQCPADGTNPPLPPVESIEPQTMSLFVAKPATAAAQQPFNTPPQKTHRPSLAESLKWGWVQFLATFTALWWLASRFEAAVFRFRLLGTRIISDAAPPLKGAHKY